MAVETISQSYVVRLPRRTVWEALQDPELVRQCITGCQRLEADSGHRYRATLRLKIGPVSKSVKGTVMVTDLVPEVFFSFRRGSNQPYQGPGAFSGAVHFNDHADGTQLDVNLQIEASPLLLGALSLFGRSPIETRMNEFMKRLEQNAIAKFGSAA